MVGTHTPHQGRSQTQHATHAQIHTHIYIQHVHAVRTIWTLKSIHRTEILLCGRGQRGSYVGKEKEKENRKNGMGVRPRASWRSLESGSFGRLREFAIVERSHLSIVEVSRWMDEGRMKLRERERDGDDAPTNLDEDGLDAVVPVPVGEDGQLGRVYFAIGLRDEGQIDARDELDRGRKVGVCVATVYL